MHPCSSNPCCSRLSCTQKWMKMKTQHSQTLGCSESSANREIYSVKCWHEKHQKKARRVVVNACNPSTLGGWGERITWGQEFETSLNNTEKPCLCWKYEISRLWWQAPVIPATWEAEARELLKAGRQRLQWAEIAPLHSSLGNKSETPSQNKPKQNKKTPKRPQISKLNLQFRH